MATAFICPRWAGAYLWWCATSGTGILQYGGMWCKWGECCSIREYGGMKDRWGSHGGHLCGFYALATMVLQLCVTAVARRL